mgnify:CR=1 FL=1
MILRFKIHYQTHWGQQLAVSGNRPELGDEDPARALLLDYLGEGYWGADVELEKSSGTLAYNYLLLDEKAGRRIVEWGPLRKLKLSGRKSTGLLHLKDAWRPPKHPENALHTSAFLDVILKPGRFRTRPLRNTRGKPVVRFQMRAPRVPAGLQLCVTGNVAELGNWHAESALRLGNSTHPLWSGAIALQSGLSIEYKYGLYDPKHKQIVHLESGENRRIPAAWIAAGEQLIVTDEYFRYPGGWWKGAGVAVPVFSLRSREGLGVGEFLDIKLMVDWARRAGLNMVQILPVNDTSATHTWGDSYPYAAISVFALHPQYLRVDDLGVAFDGMPARALLEQREALNRLEAVDYEAVMALKLRLARAAFDQVRGKWLKSKAFETFFKENRHWLEPYAAFCYLRDKHGTVDFQEWGEHADFSAKKLKTLTDPASDHYGEVAFHYFLQYHLDRQLGIAAAYARAHGVVLKGDIPIGIYRYSVDAWTAPRLYNMDGQSGAPPDPFSDTGQNWGFPTYNWEEMAKDDYAWWRRRLQQLSRYFDAFRIDHILGFFRIWEIPYEQLEGLMGHFNPALPIIREEFDQRGIPFDDQRFCRPYIPEYHLYDCFGADTDYVKETFLREANPHYFEFVEGLNSQRAIANFLARPENEARRHLQQGLFDLVGERLFFEAAEPDGAAFHPRIKLQDTRSFQDLNETVQQRLDELYVDYFYRRQEEFWRQQAMKKLPAIKDATNMLICGEDLGMVPDCVPGVMDELGILSLDIQRMSKNPATEFLSIDDIPYLSVCSPSTHDMAPLRAWWEEMTPEQRTRCYHQELKLSGDPPFFCEPYVVEAIVGQHLYWPSMWAVFPLQDLLAMDGRLRRENPFEERINVPSNPRHYWRYRFHLPLEQLLEEDAFNDYLRSMVAAAGRGSPA